MMMWYAPRAKITGYRLFLTVEGSNPKQLRLPARLTEYTLLNLRPDTEYTATLHAEQDNTLSVGESAVFTTSECLTQAMRFLCECGLNMLLIHSHLCSLCVYRPTNGKRSSFQH